MSKLSPILAPEANRAQLVAQLILSSMAVLMVGILAWAGWKGAFPGLTRAFKGQLPSGEVATPTVGMSAALPPNVLAVNSLPVAGNTTMSLPPASPPRPTEPAPRVDRIAPISLSTPMPASTVLPAPGTIATPTMASLSSAPAPVSTTLANVPPGTLSRPINNPQAREMVEQARQMRKLGDMQAALASLRAADLNEPRHPEILSEMAMTYEVMQLSDKAENAWRAVLALGEPAAGGYYGLARNKIESLIDSQKTATFAAPPTKPVTLGVCQVIPDKSVTKGQRVTLRVPLVAAPGAAIDASQVMLHVYFYDKAADGSVSPTHADQPVFNWVSENVDWKTSGTEMVDVIYNMPELKPEELRNLGKRSYYGYVAKLFYQDQFMGEQAEPKALLDFKPQGAGPAGMNNALFPKN